MLGVRKDRRMTQQVQEHAAGLAAAAPSTYPDGAPFPAPQALNALDDLMLRMRKMNHVDAEAIILRLGWMMALFGEVADLHRYWELNGEVDRMVEAVMKNP